MNVLVDTSVWSLAFRRDAPPNIAEIRILARCIESQDILFSTGIIVQELLQGFRGPKQRERLIEHFSSLPLIQIGTIDALLAQLAIGHDLEFLTTDKDFILMAHHVPLRILASTDG